MEFHKRLKELRERRGITPKDMSKKLEISLSTYRDWEYGRKIQGEPYLDIAKILDVSLNELFGNNSDSYKEYKNAVEELKRIIKELDKIGDSFF